MELRVNDRLIEKPAADDVVRALDAPSFPEDWSIVLDNGAGAVLDAVAQADGAFTLAHDDGKGRRDAAPNVDAATLKAVCLKFLTGDRRWRDECCWEKGLEETRPPTALKPGAKPKQGAGTKFVPDTRPLIGRSGEPPGWAKAILVGIIGLVVAIFTIGQLNYSFLRSIIPFADSHYFWVGLIALPMVALLAVAAASKLVEFRNASTWTETTGRILRSQVETRRHRFAGEPETVRNVPAVEYEFKAGQRTVRGSRIGIGDDTGGGNTEATLARYPAGATVTVFYDPDDPKNCVLERGGPKGLTVAGSLGALAILAAFGGAIWWLVAHGPDFVRANFPNATANPEFVVAITGFGLVLLLFGIGMRRYSNQAANWPGVRGTIVRSEVESYRTRIGSRKTMTTMYRPVVEFTYPVGGRTYSGTRIKLTAEISSGSPDHAGKVAAKYPVGSTVEVHYEPTNPGNAALENPTSMAWYPMALALGCFALAVWQAGIFR